jgi:hypothetical protein
MDNSILDELRKPFHPSQIEWKPGMVKDNQALAVAYADLRAYQNRLDEVCGLDWSVTYTPWGERLVCHLTIHGITRSSTGEPDTQAERNEIAGTATEAQAFKRACAMFGLGRYLYNLPPLWVEYDAQGRTFTDKGKARLDMLIQQHYRQATSGEDHTEATPTQLVGETAVGDDGNEAERLRQQFEQLGQELYGVQWPQVCRRNVERISGGQATDSIQLSVEQLQRLVTGLELLRKQRQNGQ